MKYYILLFLSIATFSFAQELKDAEIETVNVKSKPRIATILKKLNKQLLNLKTKLLMALNLVLSRQIFYRSPN